MINYLYHNEGGSGFRDMGIMSGVAFNQAGEATISMSVDFADYNNDGYDEIIIGAVFNDDGGSNAGKAYLYQYLPEIPLEVI